MGGAGAGGWFRPPDDADVGGDHRLEEFAGQVEAWLQLSYFKSSREYFDSKITSKTIRENKKQSRFDKLCFHVIIYVCSFAATQIVLV